MTPLANYISDLAKWEVAVTPETGHYSTLNTLLTSIGKTITPNVIPASHPIHFSPKTPDFGLFSADQPRDQMPDFGVVEVKKMSELLGKTVKSLQIETYLQRSNKVLVTNFYQFVLVIRDEAGKPRIAEPPYELAKNKQDFLQEAANPQAFANRHEADLTAYLQRVLAIEAPLTSPQQVAWMLASYARRASQHLEELGQNAASSPALAALQKTLEDALDLQFSGAEGPHFFRSTLVQTLFYGIFAAWVVWHESEPAPDDQFDLWRDTRDIAVPVIQDLFYEFSNPRTLKTLDLTKYLEYTAAALNRVERATFFKALEAENAIQYFYEPFLEAFDPQLRKDLGVWYTPPEIVRYMVQRVDHVLRTDLDIVDGLADPNVVVLDPCCGTGAFLLEVMRVIYERSLSRRGETRAAEIVQQATRERLYGFEIMPAAFIVAHLQIALKLTTAWKTKSDGRRAGIYLTNALTDWVIDPDANAIPRVRGVLPTLSQEQDQARQVKQSRKILVVLGNPPYNAFAGTATTERKRVSSTSIKKACVRNGASENITLMICIFASSVWRKMPLQS